MLTLKTDRQCQLIINSVSRAINSGDISKLTDVAYKYLYLCSGFIAHFNANGFRNYYQDTEKLRLDIVRNRASNQWSNFGPSDQDCTYYWQKRDIYNGILDKINKAHLV